MIGQNGLIICRVQKKNHRVLKRIPHNSFGRQEIVAYLSILVKLRTKIVKDFGGILDENGEVIAKCMSIGNRKPRFKVEEDNRKSSKFPSTTELLDNGQTLRISPFRKLTRSFYVNDLGSSESPVILYVL